MGACENRGGAIRVIVDKLRKENNIVVFHDGEIELKVSIEKENVWLNRHQLAELFDRDIKTIENI